MSGPCLFLYAESAPPAVDTQKNLLRRCIRVILTRNPNPATDTLPLSYEAIYNTCRSLVTVSNRGDELYNFLEVELEKTIGGTSKWLATDIEERDTEWLDCFNKVMTWLEKQIVSKRFKNCRANLKLGSSHFFNPPLLISIKYMWSIIQVFSPSGMLN